MYIHVDINHIVTMKNRFRVRGENAKINPGFIVNPFCVPILVSLQ